jgi:hypothetical protein
VSYSVGVDLKGVLTVFKIVGGGDGLPGELVWFAGEDETLFGAVSEGRAKDKAAGLSREDTPLLGKSGTSRMWRDISSAAASLKLYSRRARQGAKLSMTFAIISSLSLESTAARWRALLTAS